MYELLRPFLVAHRERLDAQLGDGTNGHGLTDREAEILAWVARGKTSLEIATAFKKLRVHTRAADVASFFAPLN